VLTDLKADSEILPVKPMNEYWLAHKVSFILLINSRANKCKKKLIAAYCISFAFFSQIHLLVENTKSG